MSWYKQAKGSQKGWTDTLGDIQRYMYDAYDCRVFITKTATKITVSVSLAHMMYGHVMWQDFWRFNTDEMPAARKTYRQVKSAVDEIFNNFRTAEIPNPNLHAFLREAVRHIDLIHKPTSRIPSVDWAREHDGVKDWRNSIYGNRYPESDGF
jgi:hypothetical protein